MVAHNLRVHIGSDDFETDRALNPLGDDDELVNPGLADALASMHRTMRDISRITADSITTSNPRHTSYSEDYLLFEIARLVTCDYLHRRTRLRRRSRATETRAVTCSRAAALSLFVPRRIPCAIGHPHTVSCPPSVS